MGEQLSKSKGADLECTSFRQMVFRLIWSQGHGDLFLSEPMDFDEDSRQHAMAIANSLGFEMGDDIDTASFARQHALQFLLPKAHCTEDILRVVLRSLLQERMGVLVLQRNLKEGRGAVYRQIPAQSVGSDKALLLMSVLFHDNAKPLTKHALDLLVSLGNGTQARSRAAMPQNVSSLSRHRLSRAE